MKLGNNGILAGIVGSSCCVLPLVLIVAGLGGSFLTVFLVNYQIYFMTDIIQRKITITFDGAKANQKVLVATVAKMGLQVQIR